MPENFILQQYLTDSNICDKIIKCYKKSKNKTPGVSIISSGQPVVDDRKKSTEIDLRENHKLCVEYANLLQNVVEEYIKVFPKCDEYSPWKISEPVKVQHYKPNEGFLEWHTERAFSVPPYSARHLVYMTYLNDVTDGGETEFYHQKIKVQPKKGLTLIWPADWTYTHRGITSLTQEKYIVTGWFSFLN
jgi:prolyl 4-hydroxylase